jgi:O-methyltransferase involved in polyketide biosynthesis
MRSRQRSKTADAAAATRAAHRLYDRPVVFDDAFALDLTSAGWRRICQNRLPHWLIMEKALGALRPVAGQVLSRAQYAEDCLEEAVAEEIDQYVIIGAGHDSFVLRRPDLASRLTVFELDHPDTQHAKRDRLASLGQEIPGQLEFVPIDFESEAIESALARSSFSSEQPASADSRLAAESHSSASSSPRACASAQAAWDIACSRTSRRSSRIDATSRIARTGSRRCRGLTICASRWLPD